MPGAGVFHTMQASNVITLPRRRGEDQTSNLWQIRQMWNDALAADRRLSPMALRVGILIGTAMNRASFEAFPGRDKLAERIGTTPAMVSEAVKRLVAAGYLVVRREGRSNVYSMAVDGDALDNETALPLRRRDTTGSDLHTEQVRVCSPDRFDFADTNRDSEQGMEQGEGPSAPSPSVSPDCPESPPIEAYEDQDARAGSARDLANEDCPMTEDIDTEPDDVLAGVRQLWSGYFDGTEALRLIKGILERSWPEEVLRRARECISDCRDAEEDPPDAVSWLRGELLRLEREGDELAAAIPF